jgi:hypothetical protein
MKPGMSKPVEGRPGLRWVAWHQGGAITLAIGKRHIVVADGLDPQGATPRETLCGRRWRRRDEVAPNDYWTTGDCKTCLKRLERLT